MSKLSWLASAALLLSLATRARAQEKNPVGPRWDFFTARREVFHPLMADPREVQILGSFYEYQGHNTGDVALGHSWGMARWSTTNDWKLQWDVEGMGYSRFRVSGGVNEFETIDFYLNLPVEFRKGIWSGRFMLFHQSSHLGDDFIRRTGNTGFRYSDEGFKTQLSVDALRGLRLYAGQIWLIHRIPQFERWVLQTGFELTSPPAFLFGHDFPSFFYLASDLQSRQNVKWNLASNTVLGWRLRFRESPRAVRVQIGYFEGHSSFGQFFSQMEHYFSASLVFEL